MDRQWVKDHWTDCIVQCLLWKPDQTEVDAAKADMHGFLAGQFAAASARRRDRLGRHICASGLLALGDLAMAEVVLDTMPVRNRWGGGEGYCVGLASAIFSAVMPLPEELSKPSCRSLLDVPAVRDWLARHRPSLTWNATERHFELAPTAGDRTARREQNAGRANAGATMNPALEQLRGAWQAVRMETAGGPLPAEAANRVRYVFEGGRVTLFEDGKPVGTGSVSLDASASPATIDVLMLDGPGRGQAALGVYAIDGDRLTLCTGPERPGGLSAAGSAALLEMQRVRN